MKKLGVTIVTLVVLVALTWVSLRRLGASAEAKADGEWERFVSRDELASRFPPVKSPNESATRLEGLTLAIGVTITPRNRSTAPDLSAAAIFEPVKRDLPPYVTAQLESPYESISAPPETVARYLAANREAIDAIVAHVRTSPYPEWPSETVPEPEQPLPNLLAHMNLFRVLAASALESERAGDGERAWHCEEASWKLMSGLTRRPELISQLIAVAGARMTAGVARKLGPPAPPWFDAMSKLDFRASLLASVRDEQLMVEKLTKGGSPLEPIVDGSGSGSRTRAAWNAARDAVLRPYYRWAASVTWNAALDDVRAAIAADPCTPPAGATGGTLVERTPSLARPFAITIPSIVSAVRRGSNATLETEAARVILETKRLRDSSGAWPPSVAPIPSGLCTGTAWAFVPGPPTRLVFSGKPALPAGFKGPILPTEFVFK